MNAANDNVGPNTPLRLAHAAVLAFPGGGMTEKGLRREHASGRLVIERVAGKDYTTLADIEEMRRLCRLQGNQQDSGYARPAGQGRQPGSLSTTESKSALDALLTNLNERKQRLRNTSRKSA